MSAPKNIQLVARMASPGVNAMDLSKQQIIISRVNSFGVEKSHPIFNNQTAMMDVDEGSDYESVISSSDGIVRKRRRLNNLSHEEKIMRRKLKNREAAQSARDRKKQKMIDLERTICSLENINKELASENATLKNCTEALLDENQRLKSQLNLSSDTTLKFDKKPQIIHIKKKKIEPLLQLNISNNTAQTTPIVSDAIVAADALNNYVQCYPTPSEVSECYDVVTSQVPQDSEDSLNNLLDMSTNMPNELILDDTLDSDNNYNTDTSNNKTRNNMEVIEDNIDNKLDFEQHFSYNIDNKLDVEQHLSNDEASLEPASRTSVKSAALGPLQQELSRLLVRRLTSLVSIAMCNSMLLVLWMFLAVSVSKEAAQPLEHPGWRKEEVVVRRKTPPRRTHTRLRSWEKRPSSLRRWWGRHQKNWNPTAN